MNILLSSLVPFLLDTDSYKLSHFQMYRDAAQMSAYMTFRAPLDFLDHRINVQGMRYLYEQVLSRKVTWEDIHQADAYTAKHSAGGVQYDWPRDLWVKVVDELGGNIPIRVMALRDGETVHPQVPVLVIQADAPYERLVTWFETAIMRMWSPTTTATKAAHIKNILGEKFQQTVDDSEMWRLNYAMQDFGSRGASSAETAMTAGLGYLSVFDGTDNIISAILATRYNDGVPVGQSIIASEHSVMTSWGDEAEALQRIIDITPVGGIFACVADSYDYDNFLNVVLPSKVEAIRAKGQFIVVRPDSGNPVTCVLDGLRALEKHFGVVKNSKGFKVIQGAAIIQGDGIDMEILKEISDAVTLAGFSAQCVVYGMGGGLLQKQNRDTLSAAMKLCEVVHMDGTVQEVMKLPKTDSSKSSLAGMVQVNLKGGIPTVYPLGATWEDDRIETNMLETLWDSGPTGYRFENWSEVRARHARTWSARPPRAEVISGQMAAKTASVVKRLRK